MNLLRKQRILLVCLILLLVLTSSPMGLAASPYQDYAESLAALGVFRGTGQGFELDRAPTRVEGVVMLVRLLGAEEDALALANAEIPFTDVPAWANGYVAYAWQNQLTTGVSDTSFGANNVIDARMYVTFLLRSLGYQDAEGDFTYAQAVSFANGIGLIDDSLYQELQSNTFLRGHVARLSYDALKFPYQGTDQLLIEKLVAQGKISSALANTFLATVATAGSSAGSAKTVTEIAEQTESIVILLCQTVEGATSGSGIIISSDGTIVTNYHVIEGATSIQVGFDDGTTYTGAVYIQDYDADLDLAVLKIDKTGLQPVVLGDSDDIRLGEQVVAIGSPMGLFNTVSEGIISSIWQDEIQTTAAISHGSSGGALFNMQGEVIGVTYAGITEGENLGFAIPINLLEELTEKKMLPLSEFTQTSKDQQQVSVSYYNDVTWAPDFGKLLGYQAVYHEASADSIAYAYEQVSSEDVAAYMQILVACGFSLEDSLTQRLISSTGEDCVCFVDAAGRMLVLAAPDAHTLMIIAID